MTRPRYHLPTALPLRLRQRAAEELVDPIDRLCTAGIILAVAGIILSAVLGWLGY